MVNTVHVATAAAIVHVVPNPWIGIPLALASHFVLDTIPHWNWHPAGTYRQALGSVVDYGAAAILALILAVHAASFWVVLTACFVATVPDVIQAPYYFLQWRPKWLQAFIGWESRRQKWEWMRPWMGIGTQVVVFVVALIVWWKG